MIPSVEGCSLPLVRKQDEAFEVKAAARLLYIGSLGIVAPRTLVVLCIIPEEF